MTAAATGLSTTALITVALIPGAHAQIGDKSAVSRAAHIVEKPQPAVTAPADAKRDFTRSSISSIAAPEPEAVAFAMTVPVRELPSIKDQQTLAAVSPPLSEQVELQSPLAQLTMTSPFGERKNPLTGEDGEMHTGLDFGGSCNTPIAASAAGTVVEAGWHPYGGGKRVVISHGNGVETTYNHLDKIEVRVGQSVVARERIAAMGTTGNSTGCHLHFEVIMDGQIVDPAGWIF